MSKLSKEEVDAIMESIAPSLTGLTVEQSRQIQIAMSNHADKSVIVSGENAIISNLKPSDEELLRIEIDRCNELISKDSGRRNELVKGLITEFASRLVGFTMSEVEDVTYYLKERIKDDFVIGGEKPLPEGLKSWNT